MGNMSDRRNRTALSCKTAALIGLALLLLFSVGTPSLQGAEPIRIGAITSMTGWAGSMGSYQREGMTIAAEDINRRGGVLGRQLEVFFEDDQSNPTNSAVAATKLIRDKKVSLLVGSSITVMCMPIIAICERDQVPNISLGAGHEITVPLKKWIFRIPLTDYRLSPSMLKFTVQTLGAKKIALLHSTDASGMMGAKGITDSIGKYNASLVITEKFDPKDTTMIPQLTKIKAAKPDAIILYTSATPASVVAKNWQQLGMETTVVGSHGVPTADFVKLAGKIVDGGRWILYGSKDNYADQLSPDDPYRKNIYDPFKKALKEKYGKTDYQAPYGTGYESIHIAAEAIRIAGSDDRAAIRDGLEKIRYQGMIGEYVYSPSDHDGLRAEAYGPIIIKDGKWWPYKK
jgi:branched-chain amino acid transport system substrate-binding protein